jgi:hypothetical protein
MRLRGGGYNIAQRGRLEMIDEARHLAQEPKYFNQSSWGVLFYQTFLFFFLFPGVFKKNGAINEYMRKRWKGENTYGKKRRNPEDKEERTDQTTGNLD